jgi:capsular polysaccharide biosynthesis protein
MRLSDLHVTAKGAPRVSRIVTPPARAVWRLWRDLRRWLPLGHVPGLKTWSRRPVGVWYFAEEYLAGHPDAGSVSVVIPSGSAMRTPPIPLGVGRGLPHGSADPVRWSDRRVITLRDVRLVGGYGGSVITPDNRLLAELSPDVWGAKRHELFSRIRLPGETRLPGLTAMLATPEAPGNYGHWLFDLLPRILMLEQAGVRLSDIDHFVVNLGEGRFCRETLSAMGVPLGRVRPLGPQTAYRADTMVSASLCAEHYQSSLPPSLFRLLADRLAAPGPAECGFPKRLYLPRSGARFRHLAHEGALEPVLAKHGFVPFFPDQHSLAGQAAAFRGAEVVVGPHGTAMSNLLFCKPGTRVLEVAPPFHTDFSFWTVSSHARLTYAAILGRPVDALAEQAIDGSARGENWGTRYLDYTIDPEEFQAGLEKLLDLETNRPGEAL